MRDKEQSIFTLVNLVLELSRKIEVLTLTLFDIYLTLIYCILQANNFLINNYS